MSLNFGAGLAPSTIARRGRAALFAALAVAAVALAIFLVALVASTFAPAPVTAPPVRHSFGLGTPGGSAPSTGLFGWILALQADFYRQLTAALRAARDAGGLAWGLIGVSFAYGIFHAAGPGHGKAVIAGYVVASEKALARAVGLSFAAATLQALVAIGLVLVLSLVVGATARGMNAVVNVVETASFAAVALLGAALTFAKAERLSRLTAPAPAPPTGAGPAGASGHWHLPPAETVSRLASWRDMAGVVVAAGARPCSGAIIVLVFALAQGIFAAGALSVAAMALGTALTTSGLAALAVFAKRLAVGLVSGRGRTSLVLGAGLELIAAAFVLVLGAGLLAGFWFAGGGG